MKDESMPISPDDQMAKPISLSVIVPVYNEERFVETSLKRLLCLDQNENISSIQVIVVDDGSNDSSAKIIERLALELPSMNAKFEWRFISHTRNLGKGRCIQTALGEVTGDITVTHDADLEYHPEDILRMIPLFKEHEADVVFGSRFLVYGYKRVLFFRHQIGNHIITFLTNLISDLNLTDIEVCYKAVRTDLLKSIPLQSNDFGIEPELTIKLAKREARIFEIPIRYNGRTYKEGKKITWRDGLKALWTILRFGISKDIYN